MADGAESLTLTAVDRIAAVAADAWDGCAGAVNPFVSHAFLSALEDSQAVAAETGWQPRHLTLTATDGRLMACAPVYLKSHSYGEYVFDWGWADAYERAGGRYYPKLQVAVPFTPVPGPRLLVHPDAPAGTAERLARGLVVMAERLGVSSLHVTFATPGDCERLAGHGLMIREGVQYHWQNRGYGCFEDFLADLSSRKRKAIRRERAAVAGSGLRLRALNGGEIAPRHWDAFFRFYADTTRRKGAYAYLTPAFFPLLAERLADRVLLVIAERADGEPVAAALNLVGADAVYGRYWGAAVDVPFLHFEACYYQAIEVAIARGLGRVEAGAQGEHKIARGYLPVPTFSAHWLRDPGFRTAVARFLETERPAVSARIDALSELSPYRRPAD